MWKTALRPTDVRNPESSEPLYAYTKIRPRWYWSLKRIKLFLSIVWRVWDENPDGSVYRIPFMTAWEVSKVAKGLTS